VIRYLSLDWIDALTAEVSASASLQEFATSLNVGITQVVTDGPEGDVVYHLQVGDGSTSFGPGAAHPEDVRFVQDWDTAVAVATGVMNAQDVLATVATMPSEEWMKIQTGIAEMLAARFSGEETSVIREALAEAEAEFARGDALRESDVRRHFGLP